ncbi:hypothetical protein ACN28I_36900 [Archangium gephyra]|uniref:hypothetical protein n=1 Tax=Archangium gephyra TaxID=48 RepID=UPI003B78BC47
MSASVLMVSAQASSTVCALPARAATSRSTRERRSLNIFAVVSVTGWNRPPTPPDSSRMGLKEKVKKASSR